MWRYITHLNLIIVFPMASDESACWKASSASCGIKILSTTGCKLPSSINLVSWSNTAGPMLSDPHRVGPWINGNIQDYTEARTLTLRRLMSYIYMEHPFLMFLDHTQRCSTVGRTPLDEWSARRRDLYLTTHDTHNRQISMPPVGFKPKISAGERPC